MTSPVTATLPRLRQPPHDPFTLLLGGRLGWPQAANTLPAPDGSLRLPRHAASLRRLTEPSGSFGGLRPPAGVAVDDGSEIWLLPPGRPTLLRFDPCSCAFTEVPCFGGQGSAPGQLSGASGIAVAAGHLFVCDSGNQRIQVVLLPHMVLAAVWRAPLDWEPTGVAVDSRFRVHVVDARNGMVHHFGWSGRYLGATTGVGTSRFIAVQQDGTLVTAGARHAYRIGSDGVAVPVDAPADDLRELFAATPFEVARDGSMHLGPRCVPPSGSWFDAAGNPTSAPPAPGPAYQRTATTVVGPLDSLIDDCAWHRVSILGELPPGGAIRMDTLTARVPLSAVEVGALPAQAWETRLTSTAFENGEWDGLVRSPAGRYLWLRLTLTGNGATTPRIDEAVVEFPRISLRRYLPAVYGTEPTSADFTDRLLAIVDRSLRNTEASVDDVPALLDPHATQHLDWLASWIGVKPDHRLPQDRQRDLVAAAGRLLDLRGTAAGLRALLLVAVGLGGSPVCPAGGCGSCPEPRHTCLPRPVVRTPSEAPPLILEHFRLRRWLEIGAGTLGNGSMLWGQSIVNRSQLGSGARVGVTALRGTQDPLRDPFHVYAHRFTVFVPASAGRTEERRRALERLVAWGSPAHTQGHVEYVDARFRIGIQSSIGLDSVVARLPVGVPLGRTTLGPASVLGDEGRRSIDTSAVGGTAVLG